MVSPRRSSPPLRSPEQRRGGPKSSRIQLTAAATALALSALAGCSGDDGDSPTAEDPASTPTNESSDGPTEEPTVGTYPEFAEPDYTFVLEQFCFCPITGPVKVTVEGGEVTSAVVLKGAKGGVKKGSDAPDYLRQTINDVIAEANDTESAEVVVDWPADQDWPNTVAVDQIENAVDDEVTYSISDVEIAG
jgi:hypothetical protein